VIGSIGRPTGTNAMTWSVRRRGPPTYAAPALWPPTTVARWRACSAYAKADTAGTTNPLRCGWAVPRPDRVMPPGRLQAAGALSTPNSAIELLTDAPCETVP
jgi:hypothetical protein